MGKNYKKNNKNCIFGVILPLFGGNFPHFRGSDRGGEICNFYPFFGDFRPGGFPGPLRGKTTRRSKTSKQVSRNLGPLRQPGVYNDTKAALPFLQNHSSGDAELRSNGRSFGLALSLWLDLRVRPPGIEWREKWTFLSLAF